MTRPTDTPQQPGSSLERLLAVLGLFSEARLQWTPEEMMVELGYSRPTLYRYLKTLSDTGLLTSRPHAGYTLGPRVVEMDYLLRLSDPLIIAGQEVLDDITAQFTGTALLVRWYQDRMLCVHSVTSLDTPLSSYPRGRPMPLGRGAIARSIIASLPRRKALPIVTAHLADYRAIGLGDTPDRVLAALRQVRRDGYAMAFGEVTPGVVGTAAPIFDSGPDPMASICITMRRDDATEPVLEQLREALPTAAGRITERLRH